MAVLSPIAAAAEMVDIARMVLAVAAAVLVLIAMAMVVTMTMAVTMAVTVVMAMTAPGPPQTKAWEARGRAPDERAGFCTASSGSVEAATVSGSGRRQNDSDF